MTPVRYLWSPQYTQADLKKGYALFQEGAVKRLDSESDGDFTAMVAEEAGGRIRLYEVDIIEIDYPDDIEMFCSCSRSDTDVHCRHTAAVMYAIEKLYDLDGPDDIDWDALEQDPETGEGRLSGDGRVSSYGTGGGWELDEDEDEWEVLLEDEEPQADSGHSRSLGRSGEERTRHPGASDFDEIMPDEFAADETELDEAGSHETADDIASDRTGGMMSPSKRADNTVPGSGSAGTGGMSPADADDLSLLEEMQREAAAAEPEWDAPATERYFHWETLRDGLSVTPAVLRKAQETIRKGDFDGGIELDVGYLSRGRDSDDPSFMVGEIQVTSWADGSRAYLIFDRYHLIEGHCEGWRCWGRTDYKARLGHSLCVHEAAALLLLEQRLKQEDFGDFTDYSGAMLLSGPGGMGAPGRTFQEAPAAGGKAVKEEMTCCSLFPALALSGSTLMMGFRFGEVGISRKSRAYKIRKLADFVQAAQQRRTMRFGKNWEPVITVDRLDESGREWYSFIEEFLEEERQHAQLMAADGYGGASQYELTVKDRIPLYGVRLDRVFELLAGTGQAVEFNGVIPASYDRGPAPATGKKFDLYFMNEPYRPQLLIRAAREMSGRTGMPGTKPAGGQAGASGTAAETGKGSSADGAIQGIILSGHLPLMFAGYRASYCIVDHEFRPVDKAMEQALRVYSLPDHRGRVNSRIGLQMLPDFYGRLLPQISGGADVAEPEADLIRRCLPAQPEFTFFLDILYGTAVARATVRYGAQTYSLGDIPEGRRLESVRRGETEKQVVDVLMDFFRLYDPERRVFYTPEEEDQFRLLHHGVEQLLEIGEVHSTDRFRRQGVRHDVQVQVGVSVQSSLLDLEVTGSELSEDELLEVLLASQMKKPYYRLKSGEFLSLDEPDRETTIEMLRQMMETLHIPLKEFVSGKMSIPAYRALYVDQMLQDMNRVDTERDSAFKALIRDFHTVDSNEFEVPPTLKSIMRRYQKTGYRWLRLLDRSGFGGILADDMGLGKTLQVIAVLLALKGEGTSLIVAPASLIYNWREEFRRFAPELDVVLCAGTQAERRKILQDAWQRMGDGGTCPDGSGAQSAPDVLITSYDLLKRDVDQYEGHTFRFMVIDEAQYIKNSQTAAAKTVKVIAARTRYALTGTPIENRLSELWSIFDFLMPGFLYPYTTFRDDFETPIVREQDEQAQEMLRRMVTPFVLRRLKKDVLGDLPDKLEEVRYTGMERDQKQLYDGEVALLRRTLEHTSREDFGRSKIQILAELTRIRQLCCDPALCVTGYHGSSAKRQACLDLIRSSIDGGHKALIFSQFTSMLALLEEDLKRLDIPYYTITGKTPKEQRLRLVEQFNGDDTPVFLISLKAGGTGLNLVGADVVIHYDPWWNTAAQNQATDRAHRIGQTRVVSVYQLIIKGTIEEKILQMQQAKKELSDSILEGEDIASAVLDRDELLKILT